MKNIKILSPYFGHLPNTFLFTLKTMANNKFIKWYIISDDETYNHEINKTPNVESITMSFDEIKALIKNKIGTNLETPYKLCDYKPLYGVIFEEILDNCDYWGYCDLDMVFGDLQKFLTDKLLNTYDKILDLGHLSLYKNLKDINNSYKDLQNYGLSYQNILNTNKIYILDETCGDHISINEILENKGYKIYRNRTDFADIKSTYKNLHIVNSNNKKYDYIHYNGKNLLIKNLKNKYNQEYIYAHFQKRQFKHIETNKKINEFIITPKKITNQINNNNKQNYYLFDNHIYLYLRFRIKRKLKNLKQKG